MQKDQKQKSQKGRNGELDFLKFEAAMLILLYHSTHLDASAGNSHPYLQGFTFYVEFFFILSGMFMAKHAAVRSSPIMDPDSGSLNAPSERVCSRSAEILHASLRYLWDRFLRLAPEYYVGMLIAWIIDLFDHNVGPSYNLSLTITSLDEILMIHSARDSYQTADPATWFISALMIACAVLYPLLLLFRKWFTHYIAPLTALLIWGISYRVCGSILNMYMPLRAIMGLSFGVTAWTICQFFQSRSFLLSFRNAAGSTPSAALNSRSAADSIPQKNSKLKSRNHSGFDFQEEGSSLTALSRHLLSLLQILLNFGVLGMLAWKPEQLQWDVVLLFAVIAVIAWCEDSSIHALFNHGVFHWLGSFSYCLYLSNNAWSWEIPQMFPGQPYRHLLLWYLLFSCMTALAIRAAGKGLRIFWKKHRAAILGLFIRTE